MWQGWVNGFLGVWLFITPFFYFSPQVYSWHNFLFGIIIGFIGISMMRFTQWEGILSVIVGIWLIISTFVLPFVMYPGIFYNNMITGVLAAIAGFSAIYDTSGGGRTVPRSS